MMKRPRIGILPLYLELYDRTFPDLRHAFSPFLETIVSGFASRGIDAVLGGISRVEAEVREAVSRFEREDVDLIATLHLAYSLSLESSGVLAATPLPVLVLDTTMDAAFGRDADPARILYNHGIHGVQDLASMLRRRRKTFEIVAGHVLGSDVLDRAAGFARAAQAARRLRGLRVLRIGEPFPGMGDFDVAPEILRAKLGVRVDAIAPEDLASAVRAVPEGEIDAEVRADREAYEAVAPDEVHRRSVRLGLGLRRRLEEGAYDGLSMNFLAFRSAEGPVDTVPFLECAKAMARGLGYAGEGDALTASLVSVLNGSFGRTTFTEIFCPDWEGNSLFLSHMGEINPAIAAERPRLCEKEFPWTGARNPAVIACAPAPGPAVLANLAPGPDDTFRLIVAPVEVLGDTKSPALRDTVRGWIRPAGGVERFLEAFSRAGGTHHSALVLGARAEEVAALATFAGIERVVLAP